VSLDEAVSQVLPERARTDMMRKAAQVFGRRDAAVRVAQLVRSIATPS
jgi:UDP-N-acetylglucosamine:LPS N-acetylglucosamine transferase